MNEKEAREPRTSTTRETAFYAGQRKGYLEAIEKAKVLEEALKFALTPHNRLICDCHERPEQRMMSALRQWEKEK